MRVQRESHDPGQYDALGMSQDRFRVTMGLWQPRGSSADAFGLRTVEIVSPKEALVAER